MVLRAIADHRLDPQQCLMVGDKPRDVEAAAGLASTGVLYGGGRLEVGIAQVLGLAPTCRR